MEAETSRRPAELYSKARASWMQRPDGDASTLLTLMKEFVLYVTLWVDTELSQ